MEQAAPRAERGARLARAQTLPAGRPQAHGHEQPWGCGQPLLHSAASVGAQMEGLARMGSCGQELVGQSRPGMAASAPHKGGSLPRALAPPLPRHLVAGVWRSDVNAHLLLNCNHALTVVLIMR